MIKCAKQKVYSPRQMDVRVTYANEILFLSKFHHLSAPSSTCIHIFRNVNFEFTWKYSSETLIKWTRWTGPGLGQTKHLAPKQTSVLWIYSTTCSRKHSIAYSNMYTFHAHAHHRCFSELFGFFRCEKLAKRVRNTYKSHQNMDVRINSDKPWTWEFIPKQFYCDVLLLLIFFFSAIVTFAVSAFLLLLHRCGCGCWFAFFFFVFSFHNRSFQFNFVCYFLSFFSWLPLLIATKKREQ